MTKEQRDQMILDNLGLVAYSLKLLGHQHNKDYYQQGILELIRCVDNFDETKGKKFSTYAVNSLKWYLKEHIQRDHVIKPNRVGSKKGMVTTVRTESLDNPLQIGNEANSSRYDFHDIVTSETHLQSLDSKLKFEDFITYAIRNFNLNYEHYKIFADYKLNGWDTYQTLCIKYKIPKKELKVIVYEVQEVLKKAYQSYNG